MSRTRIIVVAAVFAVALGCSDDAPAPAPSGSSIVPGGAAPAASATASGAGMGRPVISRVAITPPELRPATELRAVVDASDPDGDPLRFEYVWSLNGREVQRSERANYFLLEVSRGDQLQVQVTATDGVNKSEPAQTSARAGNRGPVLSAVTLEPFGDVRAGETLSAVPHAQDPDNDPLRFRYVWTVNGQEKGRDRSFDTTGLKRGDKIQAKVVAMDGGTESREKLSPVLMLGNSPPVITQLPASRSDDGRFIYTFKARDPDGDRNLRFFIEKGPTGMRIDAITGVLTWKPAPSQAGVHPVEVGVKDGQGEGSTFTFQLTVGVQQQAPAARGY